MSNIASGPVLFSFLGAAALLAAVPAISAYAQQSPEFAYTAEQWATLRDNSLEYDEIPLLVHEYNNTVLQNAMSYKDYIGKDSTDIADSYYDAADRILNNMNDPDEDSQNYASQVSQYLNAQISYENMMEQGDNSTSDAETIKWGYDRTEAQLTKQAEELMIGYWSDYYSLEGLEAALQKARTDLESTRLKVAAGTATSSSLLTAEQSVTNAEAALTSAKSSLEAEKESLCLMLGWTYAADAVIGELPPFDPAAFDTIDLAADIEKARENNYSLKITAKQLSNARTDSVKDKLTQTKKNAEEAIANNVSSAYEALRLAGSSLAQAEESLAIQQNALATAERKLAAGTMTRNAYASMQTAAVQAAGTVTTRRLAWFKAYVDYQWAVNGLAQTE